MTTAAQRNTARHQAAMPKPVINITIAMTQPQYELALAGSTTDEAEAFERMRQAGTITIKDPK